MHVWVWKMAADLRVLVAMASVRQLLQLCSSRRLCRTNAFTDASTNAEFHQLDHYKKETPRLCQETVTLIISLSLPKLH